MYFSEFNILKFLNNLVNLENEKYLQSISEVSLDYTNEKSLIKSNTKILNYEKIIEKTFQNQISPATVDGLYFNFNKKNKLTLFFIEFKGDNLTRKKWKEYFKENILSLPDNICKNQQKSCPINKLKKESLNTIYEHYNDEIIHQLHIKPIESLFIGLPKLYEDFYDEKFDEIAIISNYVNCKVHIVSPNNAKNQSNSHLTTKDEIKDKYSLYVNRKLFEYETFNDEEYKENFIPKIDLFPISFLDIIVSVVDKIKANNLPSSEISKILINHISEKQLNVTDKQKEKLKRIINHFTIAS